MEQIVKRAQDCRHTRRDLSVLFQELTQEERFLLEWRIVDGWDYGDIAVRLGIPRADLVKRMHRIRTELRRKAKALEAGKTSPTSGNHRLTSARLE